MQGRFAAHVTRLQRGPVPKQKLCNFDLSSTRRQVQRGSMERGARIRIIRAREESARQRCVALIGCQMQGRPLPLGTRLQIRFARQEKLGNLGASQTGGPMQRRPVSTIACMEISTAEP